MKLTPAAIDALRPRMGKNGKLSTYTVGDGRNLFLQVTATGAKSWLFIYRANGKQRELGLGSFTGAGASFAVPLKAARLAADRVRLQLAAGIDPIEEKIAAKLGRAKQVPTFEQCMLKVLATAKEDWKLSNRAAQERQWLSGFRDHAPSLLPMPVDRLNVTVVADALRPGFAGSKAKEQVRERIKKVLDAAAVEGGPRAGMSNPAIWRGVLEHVLPARYTKEQAVPHKEMAFEELPAFVTALQARIAAGDNAAAGLLFTILNANRTDEVREMVRSEVNLETGVWTIPASRMKAEKEHVITLARQSVDLLRSLPECVGNPHFFWGEKKGQPVGESAFLDRLYEMGHEGKATVHGFRATFTDWSGEGGQSVEATEMATAHAVKGARANYRRRKATALRANLLQDYADYCFGVVGGDNVVGLKVAA
jgi:integrase